MSHPTSRCYPRTLNQAFSKTTEYACAIEVPHTESIAKSVLYAAVALFIVIAGSLVVSALKG